MAPLHSEGQEDQSNSFPGTTHITGVPHNIYGHLNYTCILNLPMVPVLFSS